MSKKAKKPAPEVAAAEPPAPEPEPESPSMPLEQITLAGVKMVVLSQSTDRRDVVEFHTGDVVHLAVRPLRKGA